MYNYGIYIDFHGFFEESEEMEEVCFGMNIQEAEAEIEEINKIENSRFPYVVMSF